MTTPKLEGRRRCSDTLSRPLATVYSNSTIKPPIGVATAEMTEITDACEASDAPAVSGEHGPLCRKSAAQSMTRADGEQYRRITDDGDQHQDDQHRRQQHGTGWLRFTGFAWALFQREHAALQASIEHRREQDT